MDADFTMVYPVRRTGEEWLVNRLQPASAIGGALCLQAIQDFGYTGEPVQSMRQAGLFELPSPATKILSEGWFSKKAVTGNQLFQAILCVGPVDPGHAMGILLWLGALAIRGFIPQMPADAQAALLLKTPEARADTTSLELGPTLTDEGILSMQRLLQALYDAYVNDEPLRLDS